MFMLLALIAMEPPTSLETDEQNVHKTVTQEKAAEIAADFVTTFYHVQVGALESQEFRATPVPHWLFCFSDTIKGPKARMGVFLVLLRGGRMSLAATCFGDMSIKSKNIGMSLLTCWSHRHNIGTCR
jgi:hypothetical protein